MEKELYSISIATSKININRWRLFIINYVALLMVYFPNAQMRFSQDEYFAMNNVAGLAGQLLNLGRPGAYFIMRLQQLTGFNLVLDQQIFFYIYLACLAACIVALFHAIFLQFHDKSIVSMLLLDLVLLFSFANVVIEELSHFPAGYLMWGFGFVLTTCAVKFFSYKGRKAYPVLSFFFLFIGLSFYQINIQLFVIFGMLMLMLENEFCFTGRIFIGATKLFVIAAFAALSNILMLKILQHISAATVTNRNVTLDKISENTEIVIELIVREFENLPYSSIGMMLAACIILFIAYVITSIINRRAVLSKIALMSLFCFAGFLSVFGLHVVTLNVWMVPRTLIGIAFIISALCIAVIRNTKSGTRRIALLTVLSLAFLVNVFHLQAISINQYANNRLDQEYALNVALCIEAHERGTGETIRKIAFCFDSQYIMHNGNIRYSAGDMNLRAVVYSWADTENINYYAGRDFQETVMDDEIYNNYFKDKNWDFFVPEEQLVFVGDTVYVAVY
jgi:hypothetical protein